jgi:hypothetical protein
MQTNRSRKQNRFPDCQGPKWQYQIGNVRVGSKRERLAAAGIAVPDNLDWAPIDFEQQALAAGLQEAGFRYHRHLTPQEANARYFAGRRDGLKAPRVAQLISATT